MSDEKKKLSKLWWLILLRGIAVLILGLMFLTAPGATIATLMIFLGAYWFIDGIFSLVGIFTRDPDSPWGLLLFKGILGILAGLVVLRHPLYSAVLVPSVAVLIIGINGLVMGVVGLVQAFKGSGSSAFVGGILNILFGIILLTRPIIGVAALPFILGVIGVIGGIFLILISIKLRKLI